MDELAHGGLAAMLLRVGALGDVAVEILRDGDLGGEDAPAFRYFHILLLEDGLAGIIGNFGGALLPFDFVVGVDAGLGENRLKGEAVILEFGFGGLPGDDGSGMNACGGRPAGGAGGGLGRNGFGSGASGGESSCFHRAGREEMRAIARLYGGQFHRIR